MRKSNNIKKVAVVFIIVLTYSLTGQINKKEYYDYKKTRIMADYQVNSAGEKNGWFKGYDENGILVNEYNFKKNLWNGLNKDYTTANTGKREIMKSETYLNGVLEGPAIYYGMNGLILKQGNYKNDVKDGKWIFLDGYSNYQIKDPEIIKTCKYLKSEATYINGEPVKNGRIIIYYYPSGKIQSEKEYANGIKIGEQTLYFPNGQMEAYYKYDEQQKYLNYKTFFYSGKIWEERYWENGTFVMFEYYEDGQPSYNTIAIVPPIMSESAWKYLLAKDFKSALEAAEKGMKISSKYMFLLGNYAHALLLTGNYDAALKIYKDIMGKNLTDKLSWEAAIKADFIEFKAKGIESESFDKILAELKIN